MEKIPVPYLSGDFVTVYRPSADVYYGLDTQNFRYGERYENWTVNDFSILRDGETWHLVGITHPTPPDYVDEFTPVKGDYHEAEHMLFHATAEGTSMASVRHEGAFTDCEKLLYPQERPDERPEFHAPHLLKAPNGTYRIICGPREMRLAQTEDFKTFRRRTLFVDRETARDPFLFADDDGRFYLLYAFENRIDMRETNADLTRFSGPRTLQVNPYVNAERKMQAASESPFLFKRKGYYYLMWAIWDGRLGVYDHRTFVFAARTLAGLANSAPVAMLPAHAGEYYSDESGDWLLSVYHPENGVSVAPLAWDE